MKITMVIPDESVLVTISLATQDKDDPRTINLGVLPIPSKDLIDGNTVDFKTPYDKEVKRKSEGTEEWK
jgi:hypothetical protein